MKTEVAIMNGQSREETGNIEYTRHRTTSKIQHSKLKR